jgi:hypothetical protein
MLTGCTQHGMVLDRRDDANSDNPTTPITLVRTSSVGEPCMAVTTGQLVNWLDVVPLPRGAARAAREAATSRWVHRAPETGRLEASTMVVQRRW